MSEYFDRLRLLGIASGVTVAILVIANSAADLVMERWPGSDGSLGFMGDIPSTVGNFLFTGLPFFVLAARRERRLVFWAAAIVLTGLSWSFAVWQIRRDYLVNFEGGANIGLGMVMMAAPIIFSVLLAAFSSTLKDKSQR